MRGLAEFSRLILFDRRGSGASDPVPGGRFPTWEEWSVDLIAVLEAVGTGPVALFAEGEAGPLALLFAASYPERVSKLILGNTGARFGWAEDYPMGIPREEAEELAETVAARWGTPELMAAVMPGLAGAPSELQALARLSRAAATPLAGVSQLRHVWEELDARRALDLISVPTLILQNRSRTSLGGSEMARYMADRIDGSVLVEVPGEDQYLFAGNHGPVLGEVAEFVTGERRPTGGDRFLTTVLFTDIVGSTEAAVALGDAEWRARLDDHDRLVREQIRRFGGREIKTTGDGFVACFSGPAHAIDCGCEVVRVVRDAGLDVRVGLHTGECERRGDDIAGLAVHIAARVGALAGPGEVLVSRTVTDLVAGSGITFGDRGEHVLKGVEEPWRLFAAAPR
jgi:class 3 adenylate cyclase